MSDNLNRIKRLNKALEQNEILIRETAIKFEDLVVANETLHKNLEDFRAFRKYLKERRNRKNSKNGSVEKRGLTTVLLRTAARHYAGTACPPVIQS